MKVIIEDLAHWPRNTKGQPLFKCTEEAYFFANLIFDNEMQIKLIRKAMENARHDVRAMRAQGSKNFDRLMQMAVKAQFYRECLEEIDRIHNDKLLA